MKWTTEQSTVRYLRTLRQHALQDEPATASDIIAALRANPEELAYVVDTLAEDEEWTKRLNGLESRALAAEKERDAAVAKCEVEAQRTMRIVEGYEGSLCALRDVVEAARTLLTDNCACDKRDVCSCAHEREQRLAAALARLDARDATAQDKTPGGADETVQMSPERAGPISSVGVAATAEDGREVPAQNRQRAEPPSDPATGTTRREPPESACFGASTGAVASPAPTGGLSPEQRADVEEIARDMLIDACVQAQRDFNGEVDSSPLYWLEEALRKGAK